MLTAALLSGAALPAAGLWAGTASAGSVCTVSAGGMVTCTFAYSSSASTWTVPSGVTTLSVVADGGSGAAGLGSANNAAGAGGAGGEYAASLSKIPDGTVLSIFTGAQGSATDGGTDAGSGGGNGTTEETGNNLSGGGGGATTVAISPYSVSNLLVVAGGGGGGAAENNTTTNRPANGGAGGGSSTTSGADGAGTDVGHGGTPTAGGTGGGTTSCPNPAADGAQLGGGDSANGGESAKKGVGCTQAGGGGGSGYYGGGGAAAYGGGGGGSAFPAAATTAGGIDVTPVADANTNTSNGTVTISYQQVNTKTTISSSKNPAAPTDNVTFTAIVTPTDGDGTVAFKNGGATIGACATQPLSFVSGSYQATCTVTGLPAGPNTITAVYSGDTAYPGSTSAPLIQNVQTPTATTLSSSLNPSNSGDAVTFTATVDPTDGGGTVGFTDGTADITGCTAQKLTLTAGKYQATCTTSSLPVGASKITAAYSGDTAYAGSTSAPLTQNVRTRTTATTTTITSSKNPGTFGQSVTFTATVTPTDGGGTVGFKNGTADITGCTAQKLTLTAGKYQATCTTSLAVGASKITAIYSGDKAYAGSTSAPLTQTVLRAPTDLTPSITFNNLEETFTVDATLDSLGTPVPGQPLTFTVGPTRLCTATTDSHGTASCVLTPSQSLLVWRTMGRFTVSYAGTPGYYPSTATNRRGL